MSRRAFGVAVLGLVFAAGAVAQEEVKFKKYTGQVGDRARVTKTQKSVTTTVIDVQGQKQEKVEKKDEVVVHVTETLAAGGAGEKFKKARRVYEKAEETADGKTTRKPLAGKTVLIEKQGAKYTFAFADGEEVTGKAGAELDREFNKNKDLDEQLFPDQPLKPGETWDIKDKVAEALGGADGGFVVDTDRVTGTGKLVRTYTKGGRTFGVVEIRGGLPLTELKAKNPVKLKPGSLWTIDITGDGCFDGTSPEGVSRGQMKILVDGEVMGVGLKVTADVALTSKTELLPKK